MLERPPPRRCLRHRCHTVAVVVVETAADAAVAAVAPPGQPPDLAWNPCVVATVSWWRLRLTVTQQHLTLLLIDALSQTDVERVLNDFVRPWWQ